MSDWYGAQYRDDAFDRPEPPVRFTPVRERDVMALVWYQVDREGRETRYYGC